MIRSIPQRLTLVFLLFFISGATGLIYEVVWLRQLILIFGSTLFATSTILATFMGGLALGAFVAGRFMDRSGRSPLRTYGVLEIGIGLYALLVPFLFGALTPIYKVVWNAGGSESLLWLSLAKFTGIAIVLLIPTTLMGASLPVLALMVADDPRMIGGRVGTLYAVNTFGAVVGTFTAGFIAIPGIGVQKTLWLTATINMIIGVVAIASAAGKAAAGETTLEAGVETPSDGAGRSRLVLAAFAVSGFGAMVLEVAWTRALGLVLGSSVYAFSLMLLTFLIGLASGGAFFASLLKRKKGIRPIVLLVFLLGASGILAYASAFLLQHMPRLFAECYFSFHPGPNTWFAIQFCFGMIVMFPATFAFGGIFPTVLQIHARSLDQVARSVGTVYAANTIGTIIGAASAGFIFIPVIGVRNSVVAISMAQVFLGLVLCLFTVSFGKRLRIAMATLFVAAFICFPIILPGWDVKMMNSGVYMNIQELGEDATWDDFKTLMDKDTVLIFAREGLTASVLVADEPQHENRFLAVNGKVEASLASDMETQLMCAHLPLLLHQSPKDVLVIGLASGISVGSAATHPVESIRVVEVEAQMEHAARLFSEHNYNVLEDDRVDLVINDARNQLQFSSDTYDVIISEPSNPWMTVASNLFTEDFFEMAGERLRPGGLFCQWVQNYSLPADDMRSIVAAFRNTFPYVLLFETFQGGVDLLLIGSMEPVYLDLDRINFRMSELRVRIDLARIGVRTPADILPLFQSGFGEVERLVEGATRNSDDNARVEFSAPKALYLYTLEDNLKLLDRYRANPLDYVRPVPPSETDRDRLKLQLSEAWLRRRQPYMAHQIASSILDGPLASEAQAVASRAKAMSDEIEQE